MSFFAVLATFIDMHDAIDYLPSLFYRYLLSFWATNPDIVAKLYRLVGIDIRILAFEADEAVCFKESLLCKVGRFSLVEIED